MGEDNGIVIERSPNTRIAARLVHNNGQEWLAIMIEKMIRDKWIMAKSIQLKPEEWAELRKIELT
jgi:hypothetical protein